MQQRTSRTRPTATIEVGVQLPTWTTTTSFGKKICIRQTLRKMKVGQSFRLDDYLWRRRVTAAASDLGMRVTTRKTEDGKLIVKLLATEEQPTKTAK